jgi:hypothetical protein
MQFPSLCEPLLDKSQSSLAGSQNLRLHTKVIPNIQPSQSCVPLLIQHEKFQRILAVSSSTDSSRPNAWYAVATCFPGKHIFWNSAESEASKAPYHTIEGLFTCILDMLGALAIQNATKRFTPDDRPRSQPSGQLSYIFQAPSMPQLLVKPEYISRDNTTSYA